MPQPIDPNTEIMRTSVAERIQQVADRASLAAQARSASEAEARTVHLESEVDAAHQKSEEVDAETRRRAPFMGKRKRRRDKKESKPSRAFTQYNAEEKPEILEDPEAHGLDISI